MDISRRTILSAAAITPVLILPGCAGGMRLSLIDAIKRLLSLSSQRAFAGLLRENGFLDSAVSRIDLPSSLGGSQASTIAGAIISSGVFKSRLTRQVNRAAEKGAELAAPTIADAILGLGINDATKIVSGGGSAATDLLKAAMGNALVTRMIPGVETGLKLFDSAIVTEALRNVTGINFAGLRDDITQKASDGIYRAIGREETAIRANPQETGDPLLIGVFGAVRS